MDDDKEYVLIFEWEDIHILFVVTSDFDTYKEGGNISCI